MANYTQVERADRTGCSAWSARRRSMEIVTTNSEAEALLLEAQLIKRFRPPYNVLLRDDKSFPFILLRADHDFPRIMKHRGARRAKGNYYGPFASAGSVNTTINALQKLFLLRSCTDSFFNRRDRPCLLYQIKRCSAPCVGRIDEAGLCRTGAGRRRISSAASRARCRREIETQMARGGRSARLRNAPRCCATGCARRPSSRAARRSMPTGVGDADVFALAAKGGQIGVQALLHPRRAELGAPRLLPHATPQDVEKDEVLARVLAQFYEEVPPPRTILVDRDLPEQRTAGGGVVRELAGRKVAIIGAAARRPAQADGAGQPQRRRSARPAAGRNRHAGQDHARDWPNSSNCPTIRRSGSRFTTTAISRAAKAVGAMVVAGPEGFLKNQYRKFNIKSAQTNDDFGMMREVMAPPLQPRDEGRPGPRGRAVARSGADRRRQGPDVARCAIRWRNWASRTCR